jgi:hypothetical protein
MVRQDRPNEVPNEGRQVIAGVKEVQQPGLFIFQELHLIEEIYLRGRYWQVVLKTKSD